MNKTRDTDHSAFVSWEQLGWEPTEGGLGNRLLFSLMSPSSQPPNDIFESLHYTGLDFVVWLNDDDVRDMALRNDDGLHGTDAAEFVLRNDRVCSLLERATIPPDTGWESESGLRTLRARVLRVVGTVMALTASSRYPTHRNVSCPSLTLLVHEEPAGGEARRSTEKPQLCDTCQ